MSMAMKNEVNGILVALLSASLVWGFVRAQDQQQAAPPAASAAAPGRIETTGKPQNGERIQSGPIRATSDVVRIDVEVTDKSGKPMKGLRAEQFTITDDGTPQRISSFAYSDIEKMETAGEVDSTPVVVPVNAPAPAGGPAEVISEQTRDRRMMVLFFDLTSMQTEDIQRAHDAAEKFVKQQMSSADLVALVTFSVRLSVLVNFTNDRAALEKGIARLVPGAISSLGEPLYSAAQNGEADVQEYTGAAYTADETEFNVFNTDQKLAAVEGLANVLAAIPGRKAVIEFTGGITQTGEENRTALRAATDAASRADVSIYSIDARGLFTTAPGGDVTTNAATGTSMFSGASVFHQTDQREDTRDTLATLSSDTGGKAFFDLGDLSDAFPKIQQDNAGYYLIGYYLPAGIKRDGRWRTIHVKVNAPGAQVRYRTGYYAPRDFRHLEKESREEQLQEAMRSNSPVMDLPIAVETAVFRLSDQETYIPIAAKLSSSALDWAEKHNRREAAFDFAAELRAYANGQAVVELRDTIEVLLDAERFQQVNQSSLVYQGGVVLEPGKYRLKFVARENESGRMGTFEQDILVPHPDPNHMRLSSVLLSSQLVHVEKTSAVRTRGQGTRAKLASSPLVVGGERIVPSVTRFFTREQMLYVFFQAYFPEKSDKAEKFDPAGLRAGLIFFRSGLQVNATPLLVPTEVDAKSRVATFRISLPLTKLLAGHYTVEAVVVGAGTQQSAFGRAYFALQQPPAPPAQGSSAPAAPDRGRTPQEKSPSQ
jgi:VWFA-related protein